MKDFLPEDLRTLTRLASDELGNAIQEVYGPTVYSEVETIRQKMKSTRMSEAKHKSNVLSQLFDQLKKKRSTSLYNLAHIFSVYLEVINRCEIAYRHVRLRSKDLEPPTSPATVVFVFTAHPTEARSFDILALFSQVEKCLKDDLLAGFERHSELSIQLRHLLNIILRTPMSKGARPQVKDEALQIFSTILTPQLIEQQVELRSTGIDIRFRSWVGGDKDGHPLVGSKTMVESWQISRKRILDYIRIQIEDERSITEHLPNNDLKTKVLSSLKTLTTSLATLAKISPGDGKKVSKFWQNVSKSQTLYSKLIGSPGPCFIKLRKLEELYPALVVPLEIREDSELVEIATHSKKTPIAQMLLTLKATSRGLPPECYVKGFVISMTEKAKDIQNGLLLIKRMFGVHSIPVVPLFETRFALENCTQILEDLFQLDSKLLKHLTKYRERKFEVMLGYSDSAKESGVLMSRVLIAQTLVRLDKFFQKHNLIPVFFHGSGGSIERGGGSIKEQTIWWPKSALTLFKSTIQGEMIERQFGDPLIMKSITQKLASEHARREKRTKTPIHDGLYKLAKETAQSYGDLIQNEAFQEMVKTSTPYQFLDQLKIGSRPSKRTTQSAELSLRAIPWVLCWTQTRTLLPAWWGVGSAWESFEASEKSELRSSFESSDVFKSFMQLLGFTLSKVELEVFQVYLNHSLPAKTAEREYEKIQAEYQKTVQFFKDITGEDNFLWFKPWLHTSVLYRTPMIHPLNILQIISLLRKDMILLRETTTGIASGMMTTG